MHVRIESQTLVASLKMMLRYNYVVDTFIQHVFSHLVKPLYGTGKLSTTKFSLALVNCILNS